MKNQRAKRPDHNMSKGDLERLAQFRYQLRRYLRFSEEVTRREGITPLQYLLMLQIKGFPGREWATVGELAERLQAKHHRVVSLISRCEAAALVRRSIGRSDRRRVEVQLTRKGRQMPAATGRSSSCRAPVVAGSVCRTRFDRVQWRVGLQATQAPEGVKAACGRYARQARRRLRKRTSLFLQGRLEMQPAREFERPKLNLFREIVEQAPMHTLR